MLREGYKCIVLALVTKNWNDKAGQGEGRIVNRKAVKDYKSKITTHNLRSKQLWILREITKCYFNTSEEENQPGKQMDC